MPFCPRCGVELDASVTQCPLCSTTVPRFEDLGPGVPAWPAPGHADDPNAVYVSGSQARRRFLGALGVVALTAAVVVAVVDLGLNHRLTWSWWPIASLAGASLLAAAALGGLPRMGVAAAWYATVAGLLAAFDLLDGPGPLWFWSLGLPIDTLTFGLWGLGALVWRRCQGADRVGLVLFLVGVGLVGLDALIGGSPGPGVPRLGWSLITSVVLGALAALAFLLQRVVGTQRLGRIFHF